jgi:hypothetical protein
MIETFSAIISRVMRTPETRINRNEQMDALSNPERRELLVALADESEESKILEYLQAEHDGSVDSEFEIMTHSVHLPKLDQYGFIDWDRENDTVETGPRFDDIEPLLDMLRPHEETLQRVTDP